MRELQLGLRPGRRAGQGGDGQRRGGKKRLEVRRLCIVVSLLCQGRGQCCRCGSSARRPGGGITVVRALQVLVHRARARPAGRAPPSRARSPRCSATAVRQLSARSRNAGRAARTAGCCASSYSSATVRSSGAVVAGLGDAQVEHAGRRRSASRRGDLGFHLRQGRRKLAAATPASASRATSGRDLAFDQLARADDLEQDRRRRRPTRRALAGVSRAMT